ncbi:MAG TPA: aldo/keto reductase, partial [Longimicrobiales bacterium]|nr:aldo/keto reductase [Longimicrobiales bacterium]
MRRVGSSDLEIFPLGLGASTLGSRTDESASRQILDAFLAAGGNFVDSADSYSYWVEGNRGG